MLLLWKYRFWIICAVLALLLILSCVFLNRASVREAPQITACYLLDEDGERHPIELPFSRPGTGNKTVYEYIIQIRWKEGMSTYFHIIPDDYLESITVNDRAIPEKLYTGPGRADYNEGLRINFSSYLRRGINELVFRITDTGGAYGLDLRVMENLYIFQLRIVILLLCILLALAMIFKAFKKTELALFNELSRVYKVFFVVFAVVFSWVLIQILLKSPHGYSTFFLAFVMLVFALPMMCGLWYFLGKIKLSDRFGCGTLFVCMAVTGVLQLIAGYWLEATPLYDPDAVFNGARVWASTGTLNQVGYLFGTYENYFAMYKNQYGSLFLFRCLFSVWNFFGGENLKTAALLYNVAALQLMIYAMYFVGKRLADVRGGVFSILLMALYLPFYTMGAAYYTDVMSMPFVIFVYAIYMRAKTENSSIKKGVLFAFCGIIAAIGATIKFPVIIILIAVLIDIIFSRENWRMIARYIGLVAGAALLLFFCFYAYMGTKISPKLVDKMRIPVTNQIMFGLRPSGFNSLDQQFTVNLPDLETRKRENMRIIAERLHIKGVAGLFNKVFTEKARWNYGDGTLNLNAALSYNPVRRNSLHEIVLATGRNHREYAFYATSFVCALYFLTIMGAFLLARGRPMESGGGVPWVSLFGMLGFLTIWEANSKFATTFFPMFILGSTLALSVFSIRVPLPHAESRVTALCMTIVFRWRRLWHRYYFLLHPVKYFRKNRRHCDPR